MSDFIQNAANTDIDEVSLCNTMFMDLPIGLIVFDLNLNIFKANDYIFKLFSISRIEVEGRRFGNIFRCNAAVSEGIICGTSKDCGQCIRNKLLHDVINKNIDLKEIEISHKFNLNGRVVTKWFILNYSHIVIGDDTFILTTFTDISNKKKIERELIQLGITDELTGLYNLRYINERFKKSLERKEDDSFPLSIAYIDIDKFKNINDKYGHPVGDLVLISLAKVVKKNTRDTDYTGRYGGEEFLIIFNNTNLQIALKVLSRISENFRYILKDIIEVPLTFSGGLIQINSNDVDNKDNIAPFILKLDKLLYKAKANGRNRIET